MSVLCTCVVVTSSLNYKHIIFKYLYGIVYSKAFEAKVRQKLKRTEKTTLIIGIAAIITYGKTTKSSKLVKLGKFVNLNCANS